MEIGTYSNIASNVSTQQKQDNSLGIKPLYTQKVQGDELKELITQEMNKLGYSMLDTSA